MMTAKRVKTVDQMMKMIERRVCVRRIWRCRAGWGMFFLTDDDVPDKAMTGRVYRYYPTLTACVREAYEYWVLGKDKPLWPGR